MRFEILLGWPRSPYDFFHNIKSTFFIFTSNFIDLDILSTLAISSMVELCSQLMSQFDHYQLQLVYLTMEHHPVRNLQHETSKPFLTGSISHCISSIHWTNLFLCFSCIFTFLEIIKHNMPTMMHIFFHFSIKMATQKFTNFDFFLMQSDKTAVVIQSNKIVSNEVKDSWVPLEPLYRKNQTNFLANPIFFLRIYKYV